jgi:hypothetical protein
MLNEDFTYAYLNDRARLLEQNNIGSTIWETQ